MAQEVINQRTFFDGVGQNYKPITVKITDGSISFYSRADNDEEFYWFPKNDWDAVTRKHMTKKNWFSESMADFLDQNLLKENA